MWLFTKTGFYSVVDKAGAGTRLTIRARDRADLVALKRFYLPELSAIVTLKQSDYPFRAFASADELARAMVRIVGDIDYPNFKDEVLRQQGADRVFVYHKVWALLLDLEVGIRRKVHAGLRALGM